MQIHCTDQFKTFLPPHESIFPNFVRPYYGSDAIAAEKGVGSRIWDAYGISYLDLYSGVATLGLGHCHPEVDEAFANQARRLGHLSFNYTSRVTAEYAARLLEFSGLDRVFFVNSGSEAVDLALGLAMAFTGHEQFFAFEKSYHGGTRLAKEATGLDSWRFPGQTSNFCTRLPAPECEKCLHLHKESCERELPRCLQSLSKALENSTGPTVLILEPIFGAGGILVPRKPFFEGVDRLVKQCGAVLIVDEVQTGFARCGSTIFGFQKFGLDPDFICLGKGIANGYPLGAVAMKNKFDEICGDFFHFNTFGGNTACVAAASRVLDILVRDSIPDRVESTGIRILAELKGIFSDLSWMREVRGNGYMIGLETETPVQAADLHSMAKRSGLLIGLGGVCGEVVRIQPALNLTDEEWDEGLAILRTAASKVVP